MEDYLDKAGKGEGKHGLRSFRTLLANLEEEAGAEQQPAGLQEILSSPQAEHKPEILHEEFQVSASADPEGDLAVEMPCYMTSQLMGQSESGMEAAGGVDAVFGRSGSSLFTFRGLLGLGRSPALSAHVPLHLVTVETEEDV